MTESRSNELRLELTSRIVSAYLSRNVIAPSELPHLIQ
ncbi:MucR family transcriptional regulator, partial [Sinorhizobium meliloti]